MKLQRAPFSRTEREDEQNKARLPGCAFGVAVEQLIQPARDSIHFLAVFDLDRGVAKLGHDVSSFTIHMRDCSSDVIASEL